MISVSSMYAVLWLFFCPYCGTSYPTDAAGAAHMRSAHPEYET